MRKEWYIWCAFGGVHFIGGIFFFCFALFNLYTRVSLNVTSLSLNRLNSEKFQNFEPKLSFLWQIPKNDNYGEFPDFDESTLNMNFAYFRKRAIPMSF